MRAARLCAFSLVLVPALTHAASFDCKLARTAREHAVCRDAKLSAQDSQVALAYSTLRAQLSATAAAAVQSDQRAWLHWLDITCPANIQSPHGATQVSCLQDAYEDRLVDLVAPQRLPDGHRLYTRAFYGYARETAKIPDMPLIQDPGFGTRTVDYPQVDAADSYAESFNRSALAAALGIIPIAHGPHVAALSRQIDDASDEGISYTVLAANTQAVLIQFEDFQMMHGGVHPSTTDATFTWFPVQQKALQAKDIFQPNSGWQRQLVPAALEKLQKDPDLKAGLWQDSKLKQGVAEGLNAPTSWIVSRDGLHIRYAQYQIAAYVYGMPEIVLPWTELKPYLKPGLETAKLPLVKED